MATRKLALCLALSGLVGTASGQTLPAPENWSPIGRTAQTVTGRVTFAPSEITFQNGKSLPLTRGGQMLFRPEPKKRKVAADLYRVTPPDQPILENGNTLCKGKPVAARVAIGENGEGGRPTHIGAVFRSEVYPRLARRLRALCL